MDDIPRRTEAAGRARLLDAAEALFANRGYFGATLRDITQTAGVPLGLATYHFRNKDELYRETLLRRVPELSSALSAALERAHDDGIAAILKAYAYAHLEPLASAIPGWRSYMRLVAMTMLQSEERDLAQPMTAYMPVVHSFQAALAKAAPHIEPRRLEQAFYIFQKSVLAICADIQWQAQPEGFSPGELGSLLADLTARGLGERAIAANEA
ncbi:MAG: TetR/AcrR family transcriptional regulator [Caulobacteraceae bacterium]|nr:TetR/AcrR family transcriptional regulator [Caulobacteraceae bacterium]